LENLEKRRDFAPKTNTTKPTLLLRLLHWGERAIAYLLPGIWMPAKDDSFWSGTHTHNFTQTVIGEFVLL